MFGLKKQEAEAINAAAVAVMERPAAKVPSYVDAERTVKADLREYTAIAKEVGVSCPQVIVEDFLGVLEKLNYPIYSRAEVVAYMDEKAKTDGLGYGWEWRPVRSKDRLPGAHFGRGASDGSDPMARFLAMTGERQESVTPASDYYYAPHDSSRGMLMFGGSLREPSQYDKVIPLHALKRIAGIERESKKPVHFLVSDYATAPHVKPDPFLMAVLPDVPSDMGRFIIDFWDEPGFGIDKMLAK